MLTGSLIGVGLLFAMQSSDQERTETKSETEVSAPTEVDETEASESKNDTVCRKVQVTGWRVGKKKLCYTRAQWELIEAETEDNLRRRTMLEGDARVSGRTK